ncbi:RNA polymerase II transcription factor SIII subunit A-domain-containing protein [Plectosphaerella plurivora]|uniref:RNA polymerase II transcription factor SIII subunit A-domain-containing protein n=1 Tax=Plectosphaerella plurivora TaxID=936078 RepID=A0A9P9AE23_9PEZI|nr:RNA polymerase II transcription factor SIII subunit A-domain-containing protein [Plectosphaerella plurivora]
MGFTKSLVELCMDTCQKHISQLTSFGDADFLLPRERVRELLFKINNPGQLRTIEINSPHLQSETAEFWKRLIQKEFPVESKEKNYTPKNPENWYKMYEKYSIERQASRREAEERMIQQFQGLQQKKDTRVSHIVDPKLLPRPPKTGRNLGNPRGTAYEKATGNLSFGKGSRTSNALQKARRQASEYKLIRSSLANPFRAVPTGSVKAAPVGMVNAKRIASQPSFRVSSSLSRPGIATKAPPKPVNPGMENALRPPQYISDSDDYDNEDDDDMFGEDTKSGRGGASRSTSTMRAPPASNRSTKPGAQPVRRSGLLSSAPRPNAVITRVPASAAKGSERGPVKSEYTAASSRSTSRADPAYPSRPDVSKVAPSNRAQSAAGPPSPTAPGQQSPPLMAKKRKSAAIFMPPKRRKN